MAVSREMGQTAGWEAVLAQTRINVEKDGNVVHLHLDGSVDCHSADELWRQLRQAFRQSPSEIHVHLEGVEFMDTAGVAALLEGVEWSRKQQGRRFVLLAPNQHIRDRLALSHLEQIFDIEDQADIDNNRMSAHGLS